MHSVKTNSAFLLSRIAHKYLSCLLSILFLHVSVGNGYSQHLYIKSNYLNWIFLRPSLGIEFMWNKKNSVGFHFSEGNSFWKKENKIPYYRFQTGVIDYYRIGLASKNNRYQLRVLAYAGYIQRKIYKEEKIFSSNWLTLQTKTGKDFSGDAFRFGLGLSNFFKPIKRIAVEQNIGLGYGYYFNQSETYYITPSKNSTGFIDFRFAMNFCYSIF